MPGKPRPSVSASWLRVIGGQLRGQRIRYNGLGGLRPMKERVRQALFNILSDLPAGKIAVDLFAGTGALGIEAVSRGAERAVLVEKERPNVVALQENVARIKLTGTVRVVPGDAFRGHWRAELDAQQPWLIFCCPPYALYVDQAAEMQQLIRSLVDKSPPGSVLVIEGDERLVLADLPAEVTWDVRHYAPAVLAIAELASAPTS